MPNNNEIAQAMKIHLDEDLPQQPDFQQDIRRAPDRGFRLSRKQTEIALRNALRYIPERHHAQLIQNSLKNYALVGGFTAIVFDQRGGSWPIRCRSIRANVLLAKPSN